MGFSVTQPGRQQYRQYSIVILTKEMRLRSPRLPPPPWSLAHGTAARTRTKVVSEQKFLECFGLRLGQPTFSRFPGMDSTLLPCQKNSEMASNWIWRGG